MLAAKKHEPSRVEAKTFGKADKKKPDSSPPQINPLWLQLATGFETPAEQSAEGLNLCVQTKLAVGAADDPHEREADEVADMVMRMPVSENPATLSQEATQQSAATETTDRALIIENNAEALRSGQVHKGEFLANIHNSVCEAIEPILAEVGRTSSDCPYLDFVFNFLERRNADYIEHTLRNFVPEFGDAASADAFIPIIVERATRSTRQWVRTGEITGLPEGIPSAFLRGAMREEGTITSAAGAIKPKAKPGVVRLDHSPGAVLSRLGPGRSLDSDVSSRMGSAFDTDFTNVRMHDDAAGANLSTELNARAFTVGHHVAFGSGEFRPGTLVGDALIAHELAHVAQQRGASELMSARTKTGDRGDDILEDDADSSAVGAVVSMWSCGKMALADIGENAMPRLKSGLKLQRCSDDFLPLKLPDYDATVKKLHKLYTQKEAIARGKQPLSDLEGLEEQIDKQIALLRINGILASKDDIYKMVMRSGGPAEMRVLNGKIARVPSGDVHEYERVKLNLSMDYLPPDKKVTRKWYWRLNNGRSAMLALRKGVPSGDSVELDELFWNIYSFNQSSDPASKLYSKKLNKLQLSCWIYLDDEEKPSAKIHSDEFELKKRQLGTIEIESAQAIAIKGGHAEFTVKNWVLEWKNYYLKWLVDGKKVDENVPVLRRIFDKSGTRKIMAKIYRIDRGFWGDTKTFLQSAETTIEVKDPETVGSEALAAEEKLRKGRPPQSLAEFAQSTTETLPEIRGRIAMGGRQAEFWKERLEAKQEQLSGIKEKVPFYKDAKPLPSDVRHLDEKTKYVSPVPSVIVYPDAGVQPISIFLSVEHAEGKWKAKFVDTTGKKVIEFDDEGSTPGKAIEAAFADWKDDNPYPRGGTVVTTFRRIGASLGRSFTTNSIGKDVEAWVDGILIVGGIVIGALLLSAPEATITKVLGWALLGLAVARSGSQIVKNLDLGYGALDKENVIEGLNILGAALGVGGSLLRSVGASVRTISPLMYRIGNGMVIGSLAGDVGTLVYVTNDAFARLRSAEGDPTMSEADRNAQRMRVISNLLLSGALVFISNRSLFKDVRASEFIKRRLPSSEKVEIGQATRLDIELEMRKSGADPEGIRKLGDRELLSQFLVMQRRKVAIERLAAIRETLSKASRQEFDAMRLQHDTAESFMAAVEKMGDPKRHFEGLAAKRKATAETKTETETGVPPKTGAAIPTASKSELLAATKRLQKLDPASEVQVAPDKLLALSESGEIDVAPDAQIRINGEIDVHPRKLAAMSDPEITDLLTTTRALKKKGSFDALSKEEKKKLELLSKGELRLRFEYQRKLADDLLKQLDLEGKDLFKNMTDFERERIYGGVVTESIPKGAENLQAQAADYAMSRGPKSVAEFVDHYQFYLKEFGKRRTSALRDYDKRVATKFEAWEKANPVDAKNVKLVQKQRSKIKDAVDKELGITGSYRKALTTKTEAEMAADPTKLGVSGEAARKEVGAAYDDLVKQIGGRVGGGEIPSSLLPNEVIKKVQGLKEVQFGSESAAAYHTNKHYPNEVPPSERGGNAFDAYFASAQETIKNPTEPVIHTVTQDGNARSYLFVRNVEEGGKVYSMRAIVFVTNEGRVVLATYIGGSK